MRMVVETGVGGGRVVAEADNLTAAIAAIGRNDIDTAVVDIQMPVAAGLATITGLRAGRPLLVIVVCSFHGDASTQRRAAAAGASTYITKPVSPRDLHAACRPAVPTAPRDLSVI